MSQNLMAILDLLSCPDDGQSLSLAKTEVVCTGCERHFPLHDENFVELLPRNPTALTASSNQEYCKDYLALFEEKVTSDTTSSAWGAEESTTDSWMRKRHRQGSRDASPGRQDQGIYCVHIV
jgi:uncharacterized protein YbaR (Trm112 family)